MSLDALPEPLLTARGLARHYGVRLPGGLMGRRATLKAVDGIDFELARGEILGRALHMEKLMRSKLFPISFGFPFGLVGAFPPNLPLPTKITTRVLDPIDPVEALGPDPDPAEVDELVRGRMQDALDEMARERRFPVLG